MGAEAAGAGAVGARRRGSVAVRVRRSLLSFVDLAGSERQKMAGTEGERLAEGAAINKSLLALSKAGAGGSCRLVAAAGLPTAPRALHCRGGSFLAGGWL